MSASRKTTRKTSRMAQLCAAATASLLLASGLGTAQAAPPGPPEDRPDTASDAQPDARPGDRPGDTAGALPEPQQVSPNHYGSSPFPPREPNDSLFVVDEGPGLDTGCTYRSGSPLEFDIEVDRVLGEAERDQLLANGLISTTASLRMPAYDVDFAGAPGVHPERDRVLFNDKVVPEEWLTGDDGVWKMNHFQVPIDWVMFAEDPGEGGTAEPVANTITIEIDTLNDEDTWCTSIDWAELSFTMPRPTAFAHGILSEGEIWKAPWAAELAATGIYTDHDLDMGRLDSISANAEKIGVVVDRNRERYGVDSINLVVHSKGGLDSRHYVEENDGVDRIVQLGTPNAGSPLADLATGLVVGLGGPLAGLITGLAAPAGVELTTLHMWNYNRTHALSPEVEFTVLAGDWEPSGCFCPLDRFFRMLTGEGDTIVPTWSAHHFPQMTQHTYASSGSNKDATHSGLHQSSAIVALLAPTVQQPGRTEGSGAAAAAPTGAAAGPAATGGAGSPLPSHTVTVGGQLDAGPAQHEVPLDDPSETFVSVLYSDGPEITVELVSPSGTRVTPDTPGVDFEDGEVEGGRAAVYVLPEPEVGLWTVDLEGASSTAYAVHAWPSQTGVVLQTELPDPGVASGEPVPVHAILTDDGAPLTGAQVATTVLQPGGATEEVVLVDDGSGADEVAGDGVYSGEIATPSVGMHQLAVTASGTTAAGAPFSREDVALATASSGAATVLGISDSGLDTDGNGLYDELEVTVDLEFEAAGTYRVLGELSDAEGNVQTASSVVTVASGSAAATVSFDGRTIYDAGVDGPFTLSQLRVTEESELNLMPVLEQADAHQTAAYQFVEFEHSGLRLTGAGSADGVDLDGNGLYDELDVTVEVQADSSGYYEWSGQLRDADGRELDFASGAGSFVAGSNEMVFTFDGWAIGDAGSDGPYVVTDVLMYGAGHHLVAPRAYETPEFTADQFEGYRGEVERLAGADRYETAMLVAQEAPEGSAEVLVASGQDFPDALALSAAAGAAPGSLLLTRSDLVPARTVEEIQRQAGAGGLDDLSVAGGSLVVQPDVVAALSALAGTDATVLAGEDRYETAAAIAQATVEPGATAYVVSGSDYPDALTAGVLAGPDHASVLLSKTESLPAATAAQLVAQSPDRIVVVGGAEAVSDTVLEQLADYAPTVERVAGADRYGTAAAVAEAFDPEVDVLYVATGENYPDALTVSALAGQQGAPVLLTQQDHLPSDTAAAAERLQPDRIVVIGGSEAVSPEVLEALDPFLR